PFADLRPVADDLDRDVADGEAGLADESGHLSEEGGSGRAGPAWVGGAEDGAEVAQAAGRQKSVAGGVRGDVTVGMAGEAGAFTGPFEPRHPEGARLGRERVDVGADAHPWKPCAHFVRPVQLARTSSSRASALSSLVFSASASSLTRIWRALASMRFSPADRPRSMSRRHRSRTTSATLFTSPEASFSRFA